MTTTEALNIEPQGLTRVAQELLDNSGFLLARLGFAAKARALEEFDRLGYAAYHYGVLALLGEGDRETQATIADALGYDRSWLVGLLDELEEAGLIERRRDPTDRRRHLVSLQPAGKKKLAQLRAISRDVEEAFLAPLEPDERQQLHAILLTLATHHDPRYACKGAEKVSAAKTSAA
jgi:MarR family transcriptional regulator, lower aerobic nicotinate degradation pathway regulator